MNGKTVQKEMIMNMERSRRGSMAREDYEQFSEFLGLGRPTPRKEQSSCQNESISNTPPCQYSKSLAMVYPVKQEWCGIYDPEIALMNGTLFEDLNKPFKKSGCLTKCREGCL